MRIIIELPDASPFDAEAFGLWLGTIIHNEHEDGDTVVGAISVVP
jgi:hypothetical protein